MNLDFWVTMWLLKASPAGNSGSGRSANCQAEIEAATNARGAVEGGIEVNVSLLVSAHCSGEEERGNSC